MSVELNANVTSAASYPVSSAASKADKAKSEEKVSAAKNVADAGAVYEKSAAQNKPATYSVNKMSEEDRAALVQQLKQEQANRESQLVDLVHKMMSGQAKSFGVASGDDSIWKFLAKGDFTVDPATKAQAQEDISENGYWGVKQTSQRLFDFASALAGDDVEKMQKMQAAIEKGYKMAEKTWGGNLPQISQDTLAATNKLFDDYYASKNA